MRKPTKKSLTRRLDAECSRIVRARGMCWKCGKDDYKHLETAHIFSRKNRSVRWDLDNMLCSCDGCHFWSHQNPLLFAEFVKEYLGNYKYQQLKLKATSIRKWTLEEMQVLLQMLSAL